MNPHAPTIHCNNSQQINNHLCPKSPNSITTDRTGFHNEYYHPKHCRCVCRRTKPGKLQISTDLEESEISRQCINTMTCPQRHRNQPSNFNISFPEPTQDPTHQDPTTNQKIGGDQGNHRREKKCELTGEPSPKRGSIRLPWKKSCRSDCVEGAAERCTTHKGKDLQIRHHSTWLQSHRLRCRLRNLSGIWKYFFLFLNSLFSRKSSFKIKGHVNQCIWSTG